jgi:hypothetical protein
MKIKQKLYIQAVKWVGTGGEKFKIEASCFKRESDSFNVVVDIDEQEIELDVYQPTQEELTLAHVEQLQGVKTKFQAEVQQKIQSIDDQIESLLAIEYKEK